MRHGGDTVNNIKNIRNRQNMSAEHVARELGVTRQTVMNWESGKTEPGVSHIRAMCTLFGVTAEELLKEDEK